MMFFGNRFHAEAKAAKGKGLSETTERSVQSRRVISWAPRRPLREKLNTEYCVMNNYSFPGSTCISLFSFLLSPFSFLLSQSGGSE